MIRRFFGAGAALSLAACLGAGVASAQTSPYYVTDGDAEIAYRIQGGTASTFAIPTVYYPLAVRSSIYLQTTSSGDRAEYTLAGAPTGAVLASTGAVMSEQLDGAATTTTTYTADNVTGQVRSFGPDFSSPTVIFNVPSGSPHGITVDPTTGNLLIIRDIDGGDIDRYTTSGTLLGTMSTGISGLCCLAYETSTNTLWGVNRHTSQVVQINKTTGTTLQSLNVGVIFGNPWGGEMQAAAPFTSAAAVPTLSEWAMILLGVTLAGGAAVYIQRRRLA